MLIQKDKVVAINYTLTDPEGSVLDTSEGQAPLAYLHGAGNIIPGLEKSLEGKSPGDVVEVTVPPEQAYGTRDQALVQDVPRSAFGKAKVEPGMQFRADGQNAARRMVTIVNVEENTVRIDANHPLAGQTLHFNVKIVSVRDATKEEVSHGHVHEPGSHHH